MSGIRNNRPLNYALRGSASIVLSTMALGISAAQSAEAEAHAIDIEPMPLEASLNELAEQIDKQIVIASADAAGLNAPQLAGTYSERLALNTLLAETDLGYSYVNERTIAIVSQAPQEAASTDPLPTAEPIQLAQADTPAQPVATTDADDNDQRVLETITVPGFRGSLASSLARKRNADQVIDAITAEDIGQFPDQNLTESIQRIAGVQITRNNGEGEQVNIRGLICPVHPG